MGGGAPSLAMAEPKLIMLGNAIERIYRGGTLKEALDSAREYKVFICEDNSPTTKIKASDHFTASLSNMSKINTKKRVLNFWSFCPGIALEDLKKLGVRSIILTSGTLSPLDSFKEDLRVPFAVELVNPHVIERNQIFVAAVSAGPSGRQLNSSFAMRGKSEYKDELGLSILAICQSSLGNSTFQAPGTGSSSVVSFLQKPTQGTTRPSPNDKHPQLKGGILVFFPSYPVMEDCVDRWKETGTYDRMRQAGSAIVIEPKVAGRTNKASASSYTANGKGYIDKPLYKPTADPKAKTSFLPTSSSNTTRTQGDAGQANEERKEASNLGALIAEFDQALKQYGTCILLAVCRGKVSEGIDFSNNRGRIVIITGILPSDLLHALNSI